MNPNKKWYALCLVLVLLVSTLACSLTLPPGNSPGPMPDVGGSNNPGNLNTPNSNNPGSGNQTALPPTDFATPRGTPLGDSPGPGTPTVPSINEAATMTASP
jgi:hypothetical protein